MAAGSNGQKNFRKAIAAIKDSTMVGVAKVNSGYKELDVAVLKATNHVEKLPKEKHVRTILGAVSGSRPRADVAYCIEALARRLAKTRTWVVALKTLIVLHRGLREVDHSFCDELICYNNSRGHMLNLLHFKDDSSPSAWDYSTWIRTYALYLAECLQCFHVLKYNFYREHSTTKTFDVPDLLEQLPAMQQLLFRLLACQPVGTAGYNFIIQYALSIVAAESVRLYVAITDGVLRLVDKFFEMQRRDAVRALEIYKKSGEQAEMLSGFFEMCRSLDFGRRQKYVKIEQPPISFLAAMEEYVKDAPQTLMLPWRANDDNTTPKLIAVPVDNLENDPDTNERSDVSADPQSQKTDENDAKAAPLIPDLLSWEEPCQESSETNAKDPFSLSIAQPEESSNPAISSEVSSQPGSWDLALVTTEGSSAGSLALTKDGALDRSVLDSLYDAAVSTTPNRSNQTAEVSSNPFEAGYNNQEMFYPPTHVGQQNFMQMAEISQQQAPFINQQQMTKEEPKTSLDYMQIAGIIPPQQSALMGQELQQQEQPIVSHSYMQEVGILPQMEGFVQEEQPMVDHDSGNPFGNPFEEQSSLPSMPQNQSFDPSLL